MQLREAKRLRNEAETTVSACKKDVITARKERDRAHDEAERRIREMKESLSSREEAARAKEARLNDIEADVEGEVGKRVSELGAERLDSLERDYKSKSKALDERFNKMTAGYKGRYYMALYYGILVTVIMAVISETFRTETLSFVSTVAKGMITIGDGLISLGGIVARLGDKIPQDVIAFIIHWLLQIAVTGGSIFGIVLLIVWSANKFIGFIKNKFADEMTVSIMLMVLAVIVICADYVALLPINLILLYIVIFLFYIVIREFIEWDNGEAKKQLLVNIGLVIILVAVIWFGLRSITETLSNLSH